MSNILEFVLKLKDMLSPGIRTAAGNSAAGINQLNQSAQTLGRNFGNAGQQAANSIRVIGQAARDASNDVNNLNSKLSGGYTMAKNIGSNLISSGISSALGMAKDQISDVFNKGFDASIMRGQFGVMAGKEKGNALFEDLNKWIADSVFGPEQFANARTLMAYGVNPGSVMGTMKRLGDVSLGDTEHMQSLSLAYGQTMAQGRLMGQDNNQYVQAGWNPLKEISIMTGKSYQSMKDLMEQGGVSSGMVEQALVHATQPGGRFYGMLDEMAKTPGGQRKLMEGNFENAKMKLGESLMPAMTRFMNALLPIMDKLPKLFDQLGPAISKAVDGFTDLMPKIMEFGGALYEGILKPIGGVLLSDSVKKLAGDFLDFATMVTKDLKPVFSGLASIIKEFIDWIDKWIPKDQKKKKEAEERGGMPAYVWRDAGDSLSRGYAIDSVKRDSIMAGTFGQFFDSDSAVNAYNMNAYKKGYGIKAQIQDVIYMALPFLRDKAAQPSKQDATQNALKDAMTGLTDKISAGGQKVVNFNFRNVVETINNYVADKKDAMNKTDGDLKGIMARLLAGVPS